MMQTNRVQRFVAGERIIQMHRPAAGHREDVANPVGGQSFRNIISDPQLLAKPRHRNNRIILCRINAALLDQLRQL